MTAADVMDSSASLLNDTAKSSFTYAVQLPYLNLALSELANVFQANNIAFMNKESADLAVVTGVLTLTSATTPAVPTDLVEIQGIKERTADSDEPYTDMQRVEFLPEVRQGLSLVYFAWQAQCINFVGATTDREIQIEYIASALAPATSSTTAITLINSKNYLAYKTAALCSMYVGENPTRAAALDADAETQLDLLLRISIKGAQVIPTRRRPFMAAYKSRGW
jgi:hypothetical protein